VSWSEPDTMITVGKIIDVIRRFDLPHRNISIDADGLGGPIVDRLREQGYEVTAIHNGGEPQDKKQFFNQSAELWVAAAQKTARREVALVDDPMLTAQLTSRRMKPRSDGRFQLESKEDMRKRRLPSPDRADATILALAADRFAVSACELILVNSNTPSDPKEEADEKIKSLFRLYQVEADRIRAEQDELPDP
jgi:hypothetical protein